MTDDQAVGMNSQGEQQHWGCSNPRVLMGTLDLACSEPRRQINAKGDREKERPLKSATEPEERFDCLPEVNAAAILCI